MPLDRKAINEALRQWILIATGLPDNKVIFEHANSPQPKWPYITLNPNLATGRRGAYDEERDGGPGVIQRVGQRSLSVSVNAYSNLEDEIQGAEELAEAAQDGLERFDVREVLSAVGLAPIDKGQLRDLTAMLETEFQERVQFDARFGAVAVSTETVGTIETVDMQGETASSSDLPFVFSFTIQEQQ